MNDPVKFHFYSNSKDTITLYRVQVTVLSICYFHVIKVWISNRCSQCSFLTLNDEQVQLEVWCGGKGIITLKDVRWRIVLSFE